MSLSPHSIVIQELIQTYTIWDQNIWRFFTLKVLWSFCRNLTINILTYHGIDLGLDFDLYSAAHGSLCILLFFCAVTVTRLEPKNVQQKYQVR